MDFVSSALIGHLVSIRVMTTLYAKGLISLEELREIADESLLDLEKFQHSHPEHEEAFEEARRFLDAYARFPGASEPDD